jgi:hypothetical protein
LNILRNTFRLTASVSNRRMDIFPPRAVAYDCLRGVLMRDGLPREDATAAAETERDEPSTGRTIWSQGVRAMKYVIGFIVGVAVTIGGVAVYDNMQPGAANQLVNWTNANDLQRNTVDYVKAQVDRLAKQLGII